MNSLRNMVLAIFTASTLSVAAQEAPRKMPFSALAENGFRLISTSGDDRTINLIFQNDEGAIYICMATAFNGNVVQDCSLAKQR